IPCRVAAHVAGNGEGEWYPFVANDEVVVMVPEGDERAGCLIVGRLNNGIDLFPSSVGGQDPTKNAFAFRRLKVPFILETASSHLMISAVTKAFVLLDKTGDITLSNADNAFLALHADMLTLQDGDALAVVQIDTKAKSISLDAQGTK